jgi:hypothetical protein
MWATSFAVSRQFYLYYQHQFIVFLHFVYRCHKFILININILYKLKMYTGNRVIGMVVSVNEWLLFNAKWILFQLYHSENMLYFVGMMIIIAALYLTKKLSWMLAHWNNIPQIDMSSQSDILFGFRVKLSLLQVQIGGGANTNFITLWFDTTGARAHYLLE